MFLPTLLMRDYGWAAWFIFAIPNILGAAAMGWTVRSPDHARALVDAHRPAMVLFSAVTRAFQWYFAFGLLARAWAGGTLPAVAGALAIGLAVSAAGLRGKARRPGVGLIFWLLSAGLLTAAWRAMDDGRAGFAATWGVKGGGAVPLTALAASCLFGFAFCPYLDLTFQRARTQAASGKGAFGLGFGFFFASMIAGTAIYAKLPWRIETLAAVLTAMHIASQLAFTVEAHSAELLPAGDGATPRPRLDRLVRHAPLASMVVGLASLAAVQSASGPLGGRSEAFEWGYRVYMGFYGLVFPAYVLIAMLPSWRSPRPPSPHVVRAWLLATAAGFPAAYAAFIGGAMPWVWAMLAAVMAAAWYSHPLRPPHPPRPAATR
jgi:hypothetical protein